MDTPITAAASGCPARRHPAGQTGGRANMPCVRVCAGSDLVASEGPSRRPPPSVWGTSDVSSRPSPVVTFPNRSRTIGRAGRAAREAVPSYVGPCSPPGPGLDLVPWLGKPQPGEAKPSSHPPPNSFGGKPVPGSSITSRRVAQPAHKPLALFTTREPFPSEDSNSTACPGIARGAATSPAQLVGPQKDDGPGPPVPHVLATRGGGVQPRPGRVSSSLEGDHSDVGGLLEGIAICRCRLAGDRARQKSATRREVASALPVGTLPSLPQDPARAAQRGGKPPGPRQGSHSRDQATRTPATHTRT